MFGRELNYLRGRVLDLERQLAEERRENRRTERWCLNMLMRRAGTMPVPPPKIEQPGAEPLRQVSDVDIAKYEVIKLEAQRRGKTTKDSEVAEWIREETGWTEADIHRAIQESKVM